MQMILLYFFLALVILGGVMLAVPDDTPAGATATEQPFSPRDILLQVKPQGNQ